ncbi:MAG: V-type ATP synthase subunit F [Candidatus Methanoperedens sp.]|nr:V-type ATP synthase subunit F [Candidatus Methanoperedens sp.]MCE8425525.1 V-type ATP synthase subunit F [Candidatus Methanoperedens sp.]MCE8426764.1 V-type ATP synthase subunit F [Candidatus Methanoperedens sp.]
MEIAVIGNSDFVLGFRLAGIRKTFDATSEDIEEKIQSILSDRSVAILVMHDNDIQKISSQIKQTLEDSVEPTVLVIGGKGGSTNLREKIKQSVGVDLWK